jgi:hypothetical protein
MKKLISLFCLSLVLAPAPWGIALNHGTQECGGYWAGDEYSRSELEPGWTDYYPDDQGMIETDIGSCTFGSGPSGDAERCCEELGYTYAGPSVGIARLSPLMTLFLGGAACAGLAVLLAACFIVLAVVSLIGGGGFLLWRRGRRKQQNSGEKLMDEG